MKESPVELAACEYAESKNLEHRKLSFVGKRGAPDRLFWGEGILPFMIEFKAPGKKLVEGGIQMRTIRSLRRSGMVVHVCDNEAHAHNIINAHVRGGTLEDW